jgi:hypothetical protein
MMIKGDYYVGDLCYVLHNEWDEVCELLFAGRDDHGCNDGEFNLKDGRRFAIYSTKYGDGTYRDQNGRSYGVDAGSIGCILLKDIDVSCPGNFVGDGQSITFDQDFSTGEQDGKITFGFVTIDTDPDYDDEEESVWGGDDYED